MADGDRERVPTNAHVQLAAAAQNQQAQAAPNALDRLQEAAAKAESEYARARQARSKQERNDAAQAARAAADEAAQQFNQLPQELRQNADATVLLERAQQLAAATEAEAKRSWLQRWVGNRYAAGLGGLVAGVVIGAVLAGSALTLGLGLVAGAGVALLAAAVWASRPEDRLTNLAWGIGSLAVGVVAGALAVNPQAVAARAARVAKRSASWAAKAAKKVATKAKEAFKVPKEPAKMWKKAVHVGGAALQAIKHARDVIVKAKEWAEENCKKFVGDIGSGGNGSGGGSGAGGSGSSGGGSGAGGSGSSGGGGRNKGKDKSKGSPPLLLSLAWAALAAAISAAAENGKRVILLAALSQLLIGILFVAAGRVARFVARTALPVVSAVWLFHAAQQLWAADGDLASTGTQLVVAAVAGVAAVLLWQVSCGWSVASAVGADKGGKARYAVFVHGFNIEDDAVQRQMATLRGTLSAYESMNGVFWPSVAAWMKEKMGQASALLYFIDNFHTQYLPVSANAVEKEIKKIAGDHKVDVLAHSRGSFVVCKWLLGFVESESVKRVNRVALMHPDVHRSYFDDIGANERAKIGIFDAALDYATTASSQIGRRLWGDGSTRTFGVGSALHLRISEERDVLSHNAWIEKENNRQIVKLWLQEGADAPGLKLEQLQQSNIHILKLAVE